MKKHAVIDLGTNTFHLLIAERAKNGALVEHHRQRIFVKLAEDGIERIGDKAFSRGLAAIETFKKVLDQHNISSVRAIGTAALRTAANAADFVQQIKDKTGIVVEVISGEEEAQLIYQGVRQVVPFEEQPGLIMDIGGGSVEFILADSTGVLWAESFPIGVAVLTRKFHQVDPIPEGIILEFRAYLNTVLLPLRKALEQYPSDHLIGASGTFDVLENVLVAPSGNKVSSTFPASHYFPFHRKIVGSSLADRLAMDGVPDSRAEMIVTALLLIEYVLGISGVERISVSDYAMKEGVVV